jgi:two-component system, OmpR family, response regulator
MGHLETARLGVGGRDGGGRSSSIRSVEILVVEDEAAIADFVARGLEGEGYEVLTAGDGVEGERLALSEGVDLVVLDRMLPGRDGMEVLAALRRAKPALPVILLTAKGEVADRVEGLDAGATDYLTKPFSFEELAARVRAHLRRPAGDATVATLKAAGMRLDLISRRVERDGQSVRLPEREAELLAYLMRRPGQVCSHADLLSSVWGYDHDPGTNVVQVYIGYLRRRLALPDSPAPIETVRSVGYRLAER